MSIPPEIHRVPWIKADAKQPLCDVPWWGTTVVLSNGDVNFCCYSNAVIGNVNEESFEKIWNGETIQHIRHELTEHRLPTECLSPSCPIYRGDKTHFILDRLNGAPYGRATQAPHFKSRQKAREQLSESRLVLSGKSSRIGEAFEFSVHISCRGAPGAAGLFIAIQHPNDSIYFLPDYEEFAVPFVKRLELNEHDTAQRIDAAISADHLQKAGTYRICAALFEPDSNPNLRSSCYWSETGTLVVA